MKQIGDALIEAVRETIAQLVSEGVVVTQNSIALRVQRCQGAISVACRRLRQAGQYPTVPPELTSRPGGMRRLYVPRVGRASFEVVEACRKAIVKLVDAREQVAVKTLCEMVDRSEATVYDAIRELRSRGEYPDIPPDLLPAQTATSLSMAPVKPVKPVRMRRDHKFESDLNKVLTAERRLGIRP